MGNNNEKKIVSIFKKFIDIDESVKRIPIYFFLVCVLLVVLIFKISQTNEYLKEIAENGKNSIEYETFDDTFIEISTENTKEKEDYIPLLEETSNENSTTELTTNENKNTSKETTTKVENETSTNQSITVTDSPTDNNVTRKTYVLNTNSKKIHLPDCSFVPRTKEENKKIVELSNEELNQYKNDGYAICKTCGGK
ncbi:MAG: hypothetical protein IKW45_03320 [Clostridia bacterium]|nr:hypothetical protein [Clostridia bacterium]